MENRWSQVASFSNARNTVCVTVNKSGDKNPRYSIQIGRPLAELDDNGNNRLSRSIQVRIDLKLNIVSVVDDISDLCDQAEEWILNDNKKYEVKEIHND